MKIDARMCWLVSLLTLVTAVTPLQELSAGDSGNNSLPLTQPSPRPAITDVELQPGGTLAGQVVSNTGQPLVGVAIVVQQQRHEAIATRSDQQGRFRLSGLQAGLSRVACGENVLACRCWSPATAPPVAAPELFLTTGESVQRGQRPIADLFTGPILIGMIIGAAIAIPIAIHNSKNNAS